MTDKLHNKGLWQGHVTHFNFFWSHDYISWIAKSRVVKFGVQVGYIKC